MTTAIIDMQKCDAETAKKRGRRNESNIVHVMKNERTTLVTLILIPLCLVVKTEVPIFAVIMCSN